MADSHSARAVKDRIARRANEGNRSSRRISPFENKMNALKTNVNKNVVEQLQDKTKQNRITVATQKNSRTHALLIDGVLRFAFQLDRSFRLRLRNCHIKQQNLPRMLTSDFTVRDHVSLHHAISCRLIHARSSARSNDFTSKCSAVLRYFSDDTTDGLWYAFVEHASLTARLHASHLSSGC